MSGWIKLHRKLLDSPYFKDGDWLKVWVWMLLTASHGGKDVLFDGKRTTLKPGQFTAGRHQIAAFTGVNEAKVKRILATLKSDQQIGQQTSNVCSLFTITNWDSYQKNGQPNGQPVDSQWTADGQPVDTNQEVKKVRRKETLAPRARNPIFDALAEVCGMDPLNVTKPEGGRIATAMAHIKQASPEVTPEEIRQRAANYRNVMPKGSMLTPTALSSNWTICGVGGLFQQKKHRFEGLTNEQIAAMSSEDRQKYLYWVQNHE